MSEKDVRIFGFRVLLKCLDIDLLGDDSENDTLKHFGIHQKHTAVFPVLKYSKKSK